MIEQVNTIDLSSLTSFIGDYETFAYFGSMILESIRSSILFSRYSFTIIQ